MKDLLSFIFQKVCCTELKPNKKQILARKTRSFYQTTQHQNSNQKQFLQFTSKNFLELTQQIIFALQKKFPYQKELLNKIKKLFQQITEEQMDYIEKILVLRDIKKDVFDNTFLLSSLFEEIQTLLRKKQCIFRKMIENIWYQYMIQKIDKYNVSKLKQQVKNQNVKKQLQQDIKSMVRLMTQFIFRIFQSWFNSYLQNFDIYKKISQELAPRLLTKSKKWANIYKGILKLLGKQKINLPKEKDLRYFDLGEKISIQKEMFKQTIKILGQTYKQYCVSSKIQKIVQISKTISNEVLQYQKLEQISQGTIDIDTQISIFQYCILKTGKSGINQSLEYVELFFEDEQRFNINYLSKLNLSHLIATLKISCLKLRERNEKYNRERMEMKELNEVIY